MPAPRDQDDEVPAVSGSARALRISLVLLFDAALVAAGVVMIRNHLALARAPVLAPPPVAQAAPVPVPVPASVVKKPAAPKPSPSPPPVAVPPAPIPARPTPTPPGRPPGKPLVVDAGVVISPPILKPPPPAGAASPDAPPPPPPEPPDAPPPPPEPEPLDAAAPPPPPEPPDAAARLDPEEPKDPWVESMTRGIRQVVEDHRDVIEDCYRRAAKGETATAPIQGRVEVHLKIVPSGDAEDVRVVENRTGSEDLGWCLVAAMRTWRYPAPGEEAMEFVWPFTFQGQGPAPGPDPAADGSP